MSTSELDKYKVDHLFLLIGENPLPNYVAAKTLLTEGGRAYLVYTEHTKNSAECLQEELGISDKELVRLDNNESNGYEIKDRIREKIKEIQSNSPEKKQFGLNYTGGTKAMAVHAYQALLHPDKKNPDIKLDPPPFFSYLDSSSLKMLIDQEKDHPIPDDIPKPSLDLSLEKLFRLHSLSLSHKKDKRPDEPPYKTDVFLPKLVENIFTYYEDWKIWIRTFLYLKAKERIEIERFKNENNELEIICRMGNWKSPQDLRLIELDTTQLPQKIVDTLSNYGMLKNGKISIQQIEDAELLTKIVSRKKDNDKNPEKICKWLEGIWLEEYVLDKLNNIKSDCSIDEIGMSFNFPPKANIAEFEFDIAFLRGYQLFAISCTTDDSPGFCKLKLFEAYRRARQMGGDEARVALVCCVQDTKKIEKIIDDFLARTNDSRVKVFGFTDLEKLSEKLQTWIEEVDA
jgi:flagellar motor protein MotB